MPADASRLYAKNVANLLALMTRDGTVAPDFDDDVVAGACLTHDGVVRHPPTAEALASLAGADAPGDASAGASAGTSGDQLDDEAENELADELENGPEKASENEGVV